MIRAFCSSRCTVRVRHIPPGDSTIWVDYCHEVRCSLEPLHEGLHQAHLSINDPPSLLQWEEVE